MMITMMMNYNYFTHKLLFFPFCILTQNYSIYKEEFREPLPNNDDSNAASVLPYLFARIPSTDSACDIDRLSYVFSPRTCPVASGSMYEAIDAQTLATPKTTLTVGTDSADTTIYGQINAPILELTTHNAWPNVRYCVGYNSGVRTHVALELAMIEVRPI